jgi:DeoD family purine-nucleoside phosphorylase
MTSPTVHIRPPADVAERVLLPGDPGRALRLAQQLLDAPKMLNHNRGLWGYSGVAEDGAPLTIQSTGMGGPSAAIVLEELCDLGLEVAVRVGTCGALDAGLALGDLVIADAALASDGASRALGAEGSVAADSGLVAALQAVAGADARTGPVASSDLFYDHDRGRANGWREAGALAVEMEAATLLRVGELRAIRVGCVLAVTDVFDDAGERHRIDADALLKAAERLGYVGAGALGARTGTSR